MCPCDTCLAPFSECRQSDAPFRKHPLCARPHGGEEIEKTGSLTGRRSLCLPCLKPCPI